jgi:hypothetical protein
LPGRRRLRAVDNPALRGAFQTGTELFGYSGSTRPFPRSKQPLDLSLEWNRAVIQKIRKASSRNSIAFKLELSRLRCETLHEISEYLMDIFRFHTI